MKHVDAFLSRMRKPPVFVFALSVCVAVLAAACNNNKESSDDTYAVVQAATLTFNEANPSYNRIQVLSNGVWEVYWEPATAEVSVVPASGIGDGSFYVADMPVGETVQIGVRTSSGKTTPQMVTITRNAPEENVTLTVSPETLTFNPLATNQISVSSNTSWTASCSDSELAFSPTSGTGDGVITVTDAPSGKSCTLVITAGQGDNARTVEVPITRGSEISSEAIFRLDFGDGSGGVWADSNDEWKTQTGTGAATVSYSMSRMRINNDNFGSSGRYSGASGKAYAKIFTDGDPGYFTIRKISLPAGARDLTISFGTIFPEGDMILEVSADESAWVPLTYKGASSYNTWTLATVGFTLAESVPQLSIRFRVAGVDRTYGLNFDDMLLVQGGGGQQVEFGASGVQYRWAELPATPADMTGKKIHTFWAETVTSKQYLRNYTYCYDTQRHCPLWIAHPQHACYQEGGYTRPETSPWAADPNMTLDEQAIIWVWPGDNRDKYVVSESPLYRWGRGHMLASGYRGCGNALDPAEINVQTFYSCNIAPQGGEVFSSLWQQAEWHIQDNCLCADTLYCVSGAHFGDNAIAAYDGSWVNNNAQTRGHIDESKPCEVPTHYYKLVLRTRKGNTGKAIQECSADELIAVGFWFENGDGTDDSGAPTPTLGADQMRSVEWIEQQTGFTFFPDVPASVKQQCNPADWGL